MSKLIITIALLLIPAAGWAWSGAASLSQLAMEGVKNPGGCKFPIAVPEITLTEICEIIPCTKAAVISIKAVPIWAA